MRGNENVAGPGIFTSDAVREQVARARAYLEEVGPIAGREGLRLDALPLLERKQDPEDEAGRYEIRLGLRADRPFGVWDMHREAWVGLWFDAIGPAARKFPTASVSPSARFRADKLASRRAENRRRRRRKGGIA
jgi:hypothetical protein